MKVGEKILRVGKSEFGKFPFETERLFACAVEDGMEVDDDLRKKPAGGVTEGFFLAFLSEEEEVGHFGRGGG